MFYQLYPLSGSVHILYYVPCKQLSFSGEILNAEVHARTHYMKYTILYYMQVNQENVRIKEYTMNA